MLTVYVSRQNWEKAVRVLDVLLAAWPDSAGEYRQRGLAHLYLNHARTARADLERYLELAPRAGDRGEVEQQVHELGRYLAGMN